MFRPDGTFRHQMDETIWFTGQWSVTDKWVFEGDSYTILHLKNIQTFLPNQRRKEEFYLCTYIDDGRSLVVFQPTRSLAAGQGLNQGHVFESKPYGTR